MCFAKPSGTLVERILRTSEFILTQEADRMREKDLVGPTRFELVTFCTPSKRATRLRYGPTVNQIS